MANKGVKILLIVILTILAIILVNFMVLRIMGKDYNVSFFTVGNETEKIFEKEYEINEIKNINVSASSSNVKFVEGNQGKIKVTAYGSKGEEINAKEDGDTLDIKKENKSIHIFMFFAWYKEEIIVEIPKDFAGNIKTAVSSGRTEIIDLSNSNLDLEASSGSISCGDMKDGEIRTSSGSINMGSGNEVNLKASSGGIRAGKINKGKVQTSSGSIRVEEIGEGEVKSTSGGIKIEKSNKITASATSGSISIETIDEFCEIETKSGGIKIENLNISENSSIQATSGGVRIQNAGDMYIDAKATSGTVKVNDSNRKSDVELKIKTTSGSIKVDNN